MLSWVRDEIGLICREIVLRPSGESLSIDTLDEDREGRTDMCPRIRVECLSPCGEEGLQALLSDMIRDLVGVAPSWDMVVIHMRGECEGMELRDAIGRHNLASHVEISIRLTWESDDEVGSDIEREAILTLEGAQIREDLPQGSAVIVTIHRPEDIGRP